MKAILIDPFAQTVTEIECDGEDSHEINNLLSTDAVVVTTLWGVPVNGGRDMLLLDDEGLFKENNRFFHYAGHHEAALAGKALMVGRGRMGESTPPNITLNEAKLRVTFLIELST
jgi:hypothetical protein